MITVLEGVPFDNLFTFHNTITRGNGYKFFKHFCHLNVRKFSFAQRIIDDWNQLLTFLIESPGVTFKTKNWTFFGMHIDFIICSLMLVMSWFL